MKGLKDNKLIFVVLAIFAIMFIFAAVFYSMIMPSNGRPQYGNRLDGIEKVQLSKDDQNKITEALEKEKSVSSAKIDIKGRIINVIIEVEEKTKVSDAEDLSSIITKNLTEAQIGYFDIQMFVTNKDKEKKGYPFIGYKGSTSKKFKF